MSFTLAPYKAIVHSDPSTWSSVQPEWMPAEIEGEAVTGWKSVVTRVQDTSFVTHYILVTATGYYEADNDGVRYRAAALHPVVK